MPKNAKKYNCEKCKFVCSKQSNWNKHLLTAKHTMEIFGNTISKYKCENCEQVYKTNSGLWKHRQKCKIQKTEMPLLNEHISQGDFESINEPTGDATTILLLLKQNQEFKTLMVEQYTNLQKNQANLQESNQKNQELQQQLVDAVKNNTGNSITHNNTTNNNQRFNINFFLNDTCKDAMNITDFLRDIDVQNNELEYIGHNGYVTGMTKMITDRLKSMDVTKRPIHCTDIKRETMYIKDAGVWCKDTEELSKLRKILSRISMNNYRSVAKWREAHPESQILASRTYDFCYRMMQALLGDVEDEQIRLDNKIIKSMAQTLYVNKNINM